MSPKNQRQPLPADTLVKSLGYLVSKAEGAAPGPIVFRITSEVLDRADDRVLGEGGKAENFARNPVLLWNHDRWSPAIGTAKVYRDGATGQWLMEPQFDRIGELSKEIAAKVDAGTLRTCSIGFRILKHAYNDEGGIDILEWELLEVSITNIPCNPEAERVKNANPNPKQKNDTTPPPESTPEAKALEQPDMDAVGALMDAKLAPFMEALGKIQATLDQMLADEAAEPEEPAPAPEAETTAPEPMPAPESPPPAADEAKSFLRALTTRAR